MDAINASNKYVKKYKNIECYTKPGLDENTYVVFVYYEIKFKNIKTTAPGIDILYVMRDPETSLVYIHNGATSNNEIKNYILAMENDEDVAKLYKETDEALKKAIKKDKDLSALFDELKAKSDEVKKQEETTTQKAKDKKSKKKKSKKSEADEEEKTETDR